MGVIGARDLAQADGKLVALSLAGARFAVPSNVVLDGMDETVAAAFDRALGALFQAGAQITRIVCPELDELPAVNAKIIKPRQSWVDAPDMRARVEADGDAAILGVGL